ncbi:outer membrane protein assembly factor BamD [Adhaeribacter aerolatus]|nr:outer membrane protein assembly factor BamD [Adhaeribacter aerolatus]
MNSLLKSISFIFVGIMLLSACGDYNKLLKSNNVDQKYEAALKYFEKKDYYRAGVLLEEVRPLLAGRIEAEKAAFLYAYTQYHERLYATSAELFRSFFDTYGRSPFAEESLFMHAKSLYYDSPDFNLDQTSTQTAIVAIQDFLNRYPESKYKEEANKMYDELSAKLERKAFENAKLYSQMGKSQLMYYQAAVTAFSTFQREYPSSTFNEEAAYLKIVAQFNLAEESVPEKQRERYFDTVGFYQAFVDKYPNSKYLRSAEALFDKSTKQLERLKAPTNTANVEQK